MNYIEIFEQLKALNTRAFGLSKKDKEDVRSISKDLNIPFVIRKNCTSCYADQLIILSIETKKHLVIVENSNCDYIVIGNKDVRIRGQRINNETITNEIAEWLISVYPKALNYIKKK